MYTPLVWIALSAFNVSAAETGEPSWKDYVAASELAQKEKKPLAVFVGSGKAGWNQVSQEGTLAPKVKRFLADNYICVYVNKDDRAGQRLASDLEMSDSPGIVISSHDGKVQAFRHEGDLENTNLERYLRRYADPERAVRTTETINSGRVSYYAPPSAPAPAQPVYYQSFGGYSGGGRSC